MATYQLTRTQTLPISLPEGWRFFSDPRNLKVITPEWLGFEILDDLPHHIYPGMIIRYRVRPLFGLPVTWVTEISQVQEPTLFVDEQRVGPYALWHHQHHFRQVESGIEATDIVTFKLPFGFLGTIAYHLFVKRKLNDIFAYRYQVLQKRFGHPIQTSKQ
ncbi:MAG: SRPBCC family protein [bacterium]|nr:SRPBCC family protein [bacterium]